ncbi:MAG TPA: hypothetical protein PK668_02585 [Myxococcota bacterium]|nr:hypothetical protein [Myxococcota bacterium]HRY94544.1 hypothetical protein [Myxococcota bacterium]
MRTPTGPGLVTVLLLAALVSPGAVQAKGPQDGKLKLNLDGVPLAEAVKQVSAFTGKNFVVEQALRERRLTVISATPVTPEEAYRGFLLALQLEGLAAIEEEKFVKIVRAEEREAAPRVRASAACDAVPPGSIRQLDDTTWAVRIGTSGGWSERTSCLASQARIVPALKDGKPNGFKLFAIRPGSLHAELGIMNGDVIQSVNGIELSSPEQALEAYTRLRTASELVVQLERRGQPRKHTYRLE